jgi:hypothetical protein
MWARQSGSESSLEMNCLYTHPDIEVSARRALKLLSDSPAESEGALVHLSPGDLRAAMQRLPDVTS